MRRVIFVLVVGLFVAHANATLTDGLVAYYPFNGNAQNQGGPAPDGQVYGAILAPDRFGNVNSAYDFDGVGDYIEVANTDGVFDLTAAWTLAAWVKPLNPGTDCRNDPIIWKIGNVGDHDDTFKMGWGGRSHRGWPSVSH